MGEDVHDLCVVGSGITGLNALVAATDYLGREARVVLVDRREQPGGMWVDTYDYVRLHQPHGNFTAGNIAWNGGFDRAHLASKSEVLQHLARCLDVARRRVDLDERFGWEYVGDTEDASSVRIELRSSDGEQKTIRARRLIKAYGHDVVPNPPLSLSSSQVRSVTPETLGAALAEADAADAVWIVGGGKTAMDTAYNLITTDPDREVHLLAGPGVAFGRRDTFFPTATKRWVGGTRINAMLRDLSLRYDGTNTAEVNAWFREVYGVAPITPTMDWFSAYLSDHEAETIRRGVTTAEREYLEDVIDLPDGPALVLRGGAQRPIAPGSLVVNCTGSLLRTTHPYERFVSDSGNVVSIQMRSSVTGVFPPFAGYFLTHLMFRDKLRGAGLYELDVTELAAKSRPSVAFTSVTLALYNLARITYALPPTVVGRCGLDYDRWYPPHRRIIGAASALLHIRADSRHYRATLDRVADVHGVRCQPVRIG